MSFKLYVTKIIYLSTGEALVPKMLWCICWKCFVWEVQQQSSRLPKAYQNFWTWYSVIIFGQVIWNILWFISHCILCVAYGDICINHLLKVQLHSSTNWNSQAFILLFHSYFVFLQCKLDELNSVLNSEDQRESAPVRYKIGLYFFRMYFQIFNIT